MKILSITAQKPHSTGSGVFLTELVRGFDRLGAKQAVIAGVTREDETEFPESVQFYPVYFDSTALPFPITGMSDEMPYRSTRYRDLTPSMLLQFQSVFSEKLREVADVFQPDLVVCHHLYLLTAIARETLPSARMVAICHGSDLRQLQKNPLCRTQILSQISKLDEIWALHKAQKEQILRLVSCPPEKVNILGTGFNHQIFFRHAPAALALSDASGSCRASDEISQPLSPIRLLFAGKLSEKKGVMSLLRALRLLPSHLEAAAKRAGLCGALCEALCAASSPSSAPLLTLSLAGGHGNEREYLEIRELAAACPYPVSFLGRLSQTALAAKMNACDLFVLPSFYEGLPLVLAEAMACGMRAVCTDLPGVQDWLCSNVPHHTVRFVTPPMMKHTDEPLPEELPAFEARLADTLAAVILEIAFARKQKDEPDRQTAAGRRSTCPLPSSSLPKDPPAIFTASLCQSRDSIKSDSRCCQSSADEMQLMKELEALSWDGLCQKLLHHF